MADTNLKNALRQAELTPEEFAEIVRVDPKTVQRWVTGTTMPYPRHRATIARALDLTEDELWPDAAPAPTPASDPSDANPAAGIEVSGIWAYDSDSTAPDTITFLSRTYGPIDLLENFRGIQLTPELTRALAEHAAAGRQIRILTNRPIGRVEPLFGYQHVEIRFIEYLEHSLLRAGDAMLLALILDYEAEKPPPLLELHRTTDGGLFGRLLENLDTIADNAEGPLTTPEQLDRYRTNYDDEIKRTRKTGPSCQKHAMAPPPTHQPLPRRRMNPPCRTGRSPPNVGGRDDRTEHLPLRPLPFALVGQSVGPGASQSGSPTSRAPGLGGRGRKPPRSQQPWPRCLRGR